MSKDAPKGMTMEELRVAIDSEAQQKVVTLNEKLLTLQECNLNLTTRLKHAQEHITEQDNTIIVLMNRCFAQTRGALCWHCMFTTCAHHPIYELNHNTTYGIFGGGDKHEGA